MEDTKNKHREPIKSPTHYALVVDEQRNKVLSSIIGAAVLNGVTLVDLLKREQIEKEFESMMTEISAAMHERGWCKLPNCKSGDHLTA